MDEEEFVIDIMHSRRLLLVERNYGGEIVSLHVACVEAVKERVCARYVCVEKQWT